MTGDRTLFSSLIQKDGGYVSLGDNTKCKVIGVGTIGYDSSAIEEVLLVEGLKHNLISISQLCDRGYDISFSSSHCLIKLCGL
ncbi:hypothetical protein EE085_29455, partial [Klebsiella pneumoniae]|nr:hypothetical protein [Klebsiella pneumoniae]